MNESSRTPVAAGTVVVPESAAAPTTPWASPSVSGYGDVAAEYSALYRSASGMDGGAVVVDQSTHSRGTFAGAKAREVLTGLVTNDVLALSPGTGCYAAALTPKGKIIADLRVFVRDDDVLVDVAPRAAAGWWSMIRKYVNPRLSRYADISGDTAQIEVFGERAHAVVAAALGIDWEPVAAMPMYAHRQLEALGGAVFLARIPDLAVEGFTVILPIALRDDAWEALVARGARPAGTDALTIARMENGRPEWGVEIDDSTLAQEANMDEFHAISYTKGCYTGQETVARVHFRGHVNRRLRGLRFDEAHLPAVRAELHDATGKVVGEVRSVAVSPRLGGIALAMVRREVAPGTDVSVGAPVHGLTARVVELPFSAG